MNGTTFTHDLTVENLAVFGHTSKRFLTKIQVYGGYATLTNLIDNCFVVLSVMHKAMLLPLVIIISLIDNALLIIGLHKEGTLFKSHRAARVIKTFKVFFQFPFLGTLPID